MSNSSPLPPAAGCHMMDSACSSSSSSISSSSNCSTSSIGSMENSGVSLINQQLAFDDAPCTVNGWQQQQQQHQQQQQQFFYAMPGGTYPTPPLYQEVQPQPPPPPPSQPQQPQQLQQTTVKPPKPKRKRVASQAQRKAANVRERRRMFNLNEAFDTLRTKVPTFAFEKRLSRIETLRLAITYIRFMGQVVNGVPPEQVRLRVACQQQQHQQQLMMSQYVQGAVPLEDLQQQQQQQQPFPQAWSQQHESSVASSSTAVWDQASAGHRMHE